VSAARGIIEARLTFAEGADARIRTGDLFLTKWSSIPGVFALILALHADFERDHLTR
jgi:hypothetical protein